MSKAKKPSRKPAKAAPKRRTKSRRNIKIAQRNVIKLRKRLKRSVQRRKKQLRKSLSRSLSARPASKSNARKSRAPKTAKASAKPAKKSAKAGTRAKAKSGKAKKSKTGPLLNVHSKKFVLALCVISGVLGTFFGHQLRAFGYPDILGGNQMTEAPGKITSPGPAQSDRQFSTYPTWAQNFAHGSGRPDTQYWNIYQGQPPNENDEAEYYTDDPANVRVGHGALSLTALQESQPHGYKYASARLDTKDKMSFLYGRMDVTAKLPSGVGTWPAVWLLPANNKYADLGPPGDKTRFVNGGEIDMIEAVGFNPNVEYGVIHTRSDLKNPGRVGAFNQITIPGNDRQYNLYTLLWTPNTITFEVNNTPFFTYTRQPGADYTTWSFDQPFYLIADMAVGGNWGAADKSTFPTGIDNSVFPASLDIKSIYYYPYIGKR